MGMTVGVVIPCHNEARTIGRLLDAIARQDRFPDDVVVVDDGSTDGTRGEVERWHASHETFPVHVQSGAGRGIGAAVNAGIRTLATDLIVRLDGHCEPAQDYVRRLTALSATADVGVSGGAWVIAPGAETVTAEAIAVAAGHPFGSGGAAYRHPARIGTTDVDTVPFGCFRRQVWETLGGYDESFGANEDYEFNWRARRSGLRVVLDPSVRCTYLARATLGALARQYFRYGRWKAAMLRKHPTTARLRQIVPAALMPTLVGTAAVAGVQADGRWLLVAAAYGVVLACAGVHAGVTRGRVRSTGLISAAFAVMHLSWSVGLWVSMIQSLFSRKSTGDGD